MNSWIQQSIFYHIYPLGFCGAPLENDLISEPIPRLERIQAWIPHLKSLGINSLYIGPLFESTSHGYDTIDYLRVDRRLGTNENFKKLVQLLHESHIKVIVDGVFNHVGRDFPFFIDLKENGQSSSYCDWFSGLNFCTRSPYNDPFSYDPWNGCYNLVKLNVYNQEVKNYIFDVIKFWINEFDIDGIRLDAADCLDLNFLKELSYFCRSIKPDLFLLGEVIHGDYSRWANKDSLDAVTNYECYKGLYSSHNDKNYFEIAYSLNRQFGDGGIYKNLPLYNFVDNHDVNRIVNTLKDPNHLWPLHAILFTMPGLPSIYYGSEWGIEGVKSNNSDIALRPQLDLADVSQNSPNKDLANIISLLVDIRKNSKALQKGVYRQVLVANQHFVFSRQYEDECIIVAVSVTDSPVSVEINLPVDGSMLIDLLSEAGYTYSVTGKRSSIQIPSCGALIMKVK
ncbi:MAG: alpha-amylase family glycosyl hydrolase [Bacillota bacterium]|nr:alpha-amylase family glycosyl hydrolase [Bacillota bacterium]